MSWVATAIGVNVAWQVYQSSQAPNAPSPGNYAPANSYVYGPDGTITSENLWVPDGSPAGGHYESRTFQGYGKEPDKPTSPTPPVMEHHPGTPVEETQAKYDAQLAKYNQDLATYNSETLPAWQKTHDEWQANKDKFDTQQKVLDDLQGKSLSVMNQGVDEIVKNATIQEQKTNLIKQQNELIDPQIAQQRQIKAETEMARGQTGSRASVDSTATLDKAVLDSKRTINENASAYAYALANQEVGNAVNVYNTIQNTKNADSARAMQQQGLAQQAYSQNNQQGLSRYMADQNAAWNKYLGDTAQHNQLTQGVSSTINGLAFLYGFKGQGGGSTPTSYGGTTQQNAPSQYNFGVPNSY